MSRFTFVKVSVFLAATLLFDSAGLFAQLSTSKPIKAFVLVGQSNMQGHAHVRTLSNLLYLDVEKKPLVHEDIGITLLSSNGVHNGKLTVGFGANEEKFGPELSFGVNMQKRLGDQPILIIKAAWGGKSLHTDFRPPSAGPFVFSDQQIKRYEEQEKDIAEIKKKKTEATGHYYRLMLDHIKKVVANPSEYSTLVAADQQIELAGFVWFQGWNDMVDGGVYPQRGQPGGFDEHSSLLAHFIRDVRNDLDAKELPFVIGVMGVGGRTAEYGKEQQRHKAVHQSFRDAMAAPASMPEFSGNVQAVLTEEFWDTELGQLVHRRDKLNNEIRRKVKRGEIAKDREKAEGKKLFDEQFSEEEKTQMDLGVSNAAYHYLGSGKIMIGIGEGIAQAMEALLENRKQP